MDETHQLNGGPVCTLVVPIQYRERRNLEIAYRRGWSRGLVPHANIDIGNSYKTAGLFNAWRAGFLEVRRPDGRGATMSVWPLWAALAGAVLGALAALLKEPE